MLREATIDSMRVRTRPEMKATAAIACFALVAGCSSNYIREHPGDSFFIDRRGTLVGMANCIVEGMRNSSSTWLSSYQPIVQISSDGKSGEIGHPMQAIDLTMLPDGVVRVRDSFAGVNSRMAQDMRTIIQGCGQK
jgi:hypothetical protein